MGIILFTSKRKRLVNLNNVVKAMMATTAAGLLVSATAMAGGGNLQKRIASKCDTNGDAVISETEKQACATTAKAKAQEKAAAAKGKCDTDGDTIISDAEKQACATTAKAMGQEKAAAAKTKCDTDVNGSISEAEAKVCGDAAKAAATSADTNGDGYVDANEAEAAKAASGQ
jgi:hypothetical protein